MNMMKYLIVGFLSLAIGVAFGLEYAYNLSPVQFKDADLIGLPLRIAIGKKGLAEGKAEWKPRASKEVELVALDQVVEKTRQAVLAGGGRLWR